MSKPSIRYQYPKTETYQREADGRERLLNYQEICNRYSKPPLEPRHTHFILQDVHVQRDISGFQSKCE